MLPQNGTREISRVRTFAADRAALEDPTTQTGPIMGRVTPKPQKPQPAYVPEESLRPEPDIRLTPHINTITSGAVKSPKETAQSVATEMLPKKPMPTAFVGLDSEFSEIAHAKQQSVFADEDEYEGDALSTGTIIRETKRKRFRLLPAMGTALLGWVGDVRDLYASSRPKEHTIASADTRAEVIIKAAEKSEIAPRNDLEVVTERLKKVERKPISATLTFKEKSEIPAPSWTYVEENTLGQPLPEPEPQIDQVDAMILADVQRGPVPQSEPAPSLEEEVPYNGYADTENANRVTSQTYATVQEEIPEEVMMRSETESPSQQLSYVPEMPTTEIQNKPVFQQDIREPERFPFILLIGVIAMAMIGGMSISLFFFGRHPAPAAENTGVAKVKTHTPLLLAAQSTTLIDPGNDRVTFLKHVSDTIAQTKDIAEIYPKAQEVPLLTGDVLRVLNFAMPDSFTRSIKEIDFGGVDGTDPYIVIQSSTFDIAFAGMLGWERYMSADLDPLFGNAFLRSYDPNSAEGVGPLHFKDIIASNKNARILYDENGKERIIYTFLDSNTILITDTKASLDRLIQRTQ